MTNLQWDTYRHRALDRAVDACYGINTGRSPAPAFETEAKRVAWLFGVYEGLVGSSSE